MRLLNGFIFGAGSGLITAGTLNLTNGYTTGLYTLGAVLILVEAARILSWVYDQA